MGTKKRKQIQVFPHRTQKPLGKADKNPQLHLWKRGCWERSIGPSGSCPMRNQTLFFQEMIIEVRLEGEQELLKSQQ